MMTADAVDDCASNPVSGEHLERHPSLRVEASGGVEESVRAIGDQIIERDARAYRGGMDRARHPPDEGQMSFDKAIALGLRGAKFALAWWNRPEG